MSSTPWVYDRRKLLASDSSGIHVYAIVVSDDYSGDYSDYDYCESYLQLISVASDLPPMRNKNEKK